MRICLVSHGFPPLERTGVENYTAALAEALVRAGHAVDVFVPRRDDRSPELALHREERGGYAVHWLTANRPPADPRDLLLRPEIGKRFGAFLDRERPDLVHFQHLVKLGIELVHEAAARGVPTVYTAHDYYPVCHRYTLLRPDLASCAVRGDAMACALCDTALGYLNGLPGLGDYQMGVLPDQVGEASWRALGALLADDPEPAGLGTAAVDAAYDRRRELDARRAEAFARIDRILAPTRFLAADLVRGGLDPERIEVLPYGIENADLLDLSPVRRRGGPVRFAFLGGLAKHKGVHLLLDAFARVPEGATLDVWGGSTDAPYVERVRARAAAVGARWGGPYERAQLPALLAEVDVVVVPSIWAENYPLVIREAFSARRPVVAFGFGAMSESVRDGVDGLLAAPRDVEDLARVLTRLAREEGLVERLAAEIAPVKGIDEQARELVARYEPLVAAARARRAEGAAEVPAAVRGFAARVRELAAQPQRELLRRAFSGLDRLAAGLGAGEAAPDRGREVDWVRERLEAGEIERGWLRGTADSLARERDWLREELARERAELARTAKAEAEQRRLVGDLHDELRLARAGGRELRAALERAERNLRRGEGHLRTTADLGAAALRAQETLFAAEVGPLIDLLHYLAGTTRPPGAGGDPFGELLLRVRDARETATGLAEELGWRRTTMGAARDAARRRLLWTLLRRTELGRTIAGWETPPGAGGGRGAGGEGGDEP
ncbi:MAG: glycosyltransferase [Planctomycetota bacterium]